jgi:hypothetical protein
MSRGYGFLITAAFIVLVSSARPAAAVQFNFSVISPPNSSAADLALLGLTVDVTHGGNGLVLFEFENTSDISSVITKIYMDDNALSLLTGGAVAASIGTVDITIGDPGPGKNNLPGGNTAGFVATEVLNATAAHPSVHNGVNAGESLTLSYAGDFAQVLAALYAGELRLGMHVQSIGSGGKSDSFVTAGDLGVPEPSSLVLFVAGLTGLVNRRHKCAQQTDREQEAN